MIKDNLNSSHSTETLAGPKQSTKLSKHSRRTFMKGAIAATLEFGAAIGKDYTSSLTKLNISEAAEPEQIPLKAQKSSFKTVKYSYEGVSDQQVESQKKLDLARQIVDNLKLNPLLVEIRIKNFDHVKAESTHYGPEIAALGVGGLFDPKKNGQSIMEIASTTPEDRLVGIVLHELGHGLDPRYEVFGYLLTAEEQKQIISDFSNMQAIYRKKYLCDGILFTDYETRVWNSNMKTIADIVWPDFQAQLKLPPQTNIGAYREEVEEYSNNPEINPVYQTIIEKYLKDTEGVEGAMFEGADLANALTKMYFKDDSILYNLPIFLDKKLDINYIVPLAQTLEIEMFAELTYQAFVNPKLAGELFPEAFEVISNIYSIISGSSLEEASRYIVGLCPKNPELLKAP